MTVDFNRDLMIGMLRKGQTGDQILQILNTIVPNQEQEDVEEMKETPEFVSVFDENEQEVVQEQYTVEV